MTQEQTIRYPLINDFVATNPETIPLIPLSNSNGQIGQFVNTTLNGGFCPDVSVIPAYFFENHAGLSFDNSDQFIDCAYTIEFVYRFNEFPGFFGGWLWLLGFTGTQDDGLFIQEFPFLTTTTLEFWDDNILLATIGQSNTFVESRWYKFAMTRDCNNLINVYVNGNFFGAYLDVNGLFYPQASLGNQIIFFQDNPAVISGESSSGHVREMNISNYAKSAEDIAAACDCMCDILADDCSSTTSETAVTTCDPDQVGVVSDTIVGTCGCDEIVTTTFTLAATPDIRDTFEICSGEVFFIEDTPITTDTTICQNFINDAGCETTRCSTVFVFPIKETEIAASICRGENYVYNDNEYSETGVYIHSFMDENGCDSLVYIDLMVFELPFADFNIQAPACHGEASGAITVLLLSEEHPPYEYAINGGIFQSFNAFLNMEAASYNISIQDANGCLDTQTIIVEEPPLLTATLTSSSDTDQNTNGTASVTPAGGTPPYTYEWSSNPTQTNPTATNLSSGNYQVTVTDANDCTWEGSVDVDVSTAVSVSSASTTIQVFPNPVKDRVQIMVDVPTTAQGQVEVYNANGQRLFACSLTDLYAQHGWLDWSGFSAGIYYLSVTMEGKSYSRMVVKY